MKICLIICVLLLLFPAIGFFGGWVRWNIIPTIKDKIKAKKLKKIKKFEKTLDKYTVL